MHFPSGVENAFFPWRQTQSGRDDYNTDSPGITRKGCESRQDLLTFCLLVYASIFCTEPTSGRPAGPWEPREVQSFPRDLADASHCSLIRS